MLHGMLDSAQHDRAAPEFGGTLISLLEVGRVENAADLPRRIIRCTLELTRQDPDQKALYLHLRYISIYGQLGRKQEALENWRKLLADVPGASAETFKNWYHLWNMRDEDIAKLMDGVYKSGVLGDEARPGP